MELTEEHSLALLEDLQRHVYPMVWYSPDESWNGASTDFRPQCRCFEEIKPCALTVFIAYHPSGNRTTPIYLERRIGQWAREHLTWQGCGFCSNQLYVNVYLFPQGKKDTVPKDFAAAD